MSQTQATNNYWTSNFPSGGLPNGTSARERQKEEARRQRAQQGFHGEGVVKNNHLFGEPRKVKPTEQDPLKDYIHAALGEFSGVASSIMEQQHLLLGVSQAPQTPVDRKGSFFGSNTDKGKKNKQVEESPKKNLFSSNQRTENHRTKEPLKQRQPSNSQDGKDKKDKAVVNGVKDSSLKDKVSHSVKESSEKTSLQTKESTGKQHRHSTTPYKIPEPKDKISKSHSSSSKKHSQSPINGVIKTECNGVANEKRKHHAKSPSKKKEDGDRQTKNKPPKLSMPAKLSSNGSEGNEAVRVDSILKEMTQLVAPPLTGIHTPIKGSSQHGSFPFPDKPVPQALLHELSGKKKEKASLSDDLHLSDDDSDDEQIQHGKGNAANQNRSNRHRSLSASSSSSGSSEDSDSDSSDSESETEAKETETKVWDLGSLASAFNQRSTNGVVESPTSTTVGDDGLRGNQIAPGVHASPEKTSQITQELDKESKDFLFKPLEDTSDVFSSLDVIKMPANIFGDQSPLPLGDGMGETKLSSEMPTENSSLVNNLSEISATNSHQEDNKTNSNSSNCDTNHINSEPLNNGALNLKVSKEKEKKEKSTKTDEAKPDEKTSKKSSKLKKETNNNTLENKKVEKTVELASTTEESPRLNSKSGKNLEKEKRATKKRPMTKKNNSTTLDKEDDVKIDIDVVGNGDNVGEQLPANGVTKVAKVLNGYSSPLASSIKELEIPVTHLVNGDLELNGENQHNSLIVTIDLGLLQRIPKIPGTNGTIVAKLTTTSPVVDNGRVKAKRQSSVDKSSEPVEIKKAKTGIESDSDDRRPRERTNSSSSASSRYSTDRDVSHRKRSPSQESDRYHKRRRHASESGNDRDRERGKSHERECTRDRERDRDRDDRDRRGSSRSRDGHRDRLRDFDRPAEEPLINGYSPNSRGDCPCWCGGKEDDSQFISYLEQLYSPDPRVPHNPDHYLQEAKKLKHKADGLSDKEKKSRGYVEAVIQFMKCGRALEQKQNENPESACQMYRETRDLLSYAMRQFVPRPSQQSDGSSDRRLMALCLRIQSVLHMKMYRLRKEHAQKNNRILLEYFKDKGQQPKGSQAPSPYNSNPSKMTGTPSPLSPTPSPSGSIGSIGSVGSTGSQEAVATPSRNGKQPSSAMASPGNTCIPQRIYSLNTQQLNITSHLVVSHEKWDQAHSLVLEHKDFFIDLDKKCGPLTPSSSVVSVSNYVQEALSRLKNS